MPVDRRNHYKKGLDVEEGRERRHQAVIEIRKSKKEAGLRRKRMMMSRGKQDDQTSATDLWPEELSIEFLHLYKRGLESSNPLIVHEATRRVRQLLSRQQDPPVEAVVQAGVVPLIVESLKSENNDTVFEAAWALTNIASTEQTTLLAELGALEHMVNLMRSPDPQLRDQCIWCLGNVAGDGVELRDKLLRIPGAIDNLFLNLEKPASRQILRNAVWALSNYCRGKPLPSEALTKRFIPYLSKFVHFDDHDVIADACWGLSYLTDGSSLIIQRVLDGGAVMRLVQLLSHDSESVLTPALRTVGNIVTGNEAQTQMVIDCGALARLAKLTCSDVRSLRREACWTASNIAAGTVAQVSAVMCVPDLMKRVIDLLSESEDWSVRKEAAWTVSNIATTGTESHIDLLVTMDVIKPLCDLLVVKDSKIVFIALEALEKILLVGERKEELGLPGETYAEMVEACGGLEKLSELPEHPDRTVATKASTILETFFEEDDDSDDDLLEEDEEAENLPSTSEVDGMKVFNFGLPGTTGNKQASSSAARRFGPSNPGSTPIGMRQTSYLHTL